MAKLHGPRNGMYGRKQTEEAKAVISLSRKNKKWMYDPLTARQKAVDLTEVDAYLARGWKLGRLKYAKGPGFLLSF